MNDIAIFSEALASLVPGESDIFYSRMGTLYGALTENNKKFNLTAITEPKEAAEKHIADSYACLKVMKNHLKGGASVIDVGAGAGFPSLVIAAGSDFSVNAIDSTAKKCEYINSVAALMGLHNMHAFAGRAEEAARGDLRGSFDAATARAVASLNVLLELCLPLIKKDGLFFSMKGPGADDELYSAKNALSALGGKLEAMIDYELPNAGERKIIIIRKLRDTPPQYPRPYAKISKKPL